jgi:hypothetical protein
MIEILVVASHGINHVNMAGTRRRIPQLARVRQSGVQSNFEMDAMIFTTPATRVGPSAAPRAGFCRALPGAALLTEMAARP